MRTSTSTLFSGSCNDNPIWIWWEFERLVWGGDDDSAILAWCAANDRIILSHDRNTLTKHAYDRVRAGLPMPGVFSVDRALPVVQAIDELLLVAQCGSPDEWRDRVEFIPM